MSTIIDNSKNKLLVTEVNQLLDVAEFSRMAVGYFYLSGFEAIKEKLHKVQNLKLIIGNRTNQSTVEELIKGHSSNDEIQLNIRQQLRTNANQKKQIINQTITEYKDDFIHLEQNDYNEKGLSALWELIRDGRIDIRVYTKGFMHSKAYIFDAQKGQMVKGVAIVGSSNLSISGLASNTELNVKVQGENDFLEVREWFDKLWEESEPFNEELMQVVKGSWINEEATPYEIYIKTLYHLLEERVNIHEHLIGSSSLFDYETLYAFQRDAVNMALDKLENNSYSQNGVFISDVVGLGKSYIALAIASWYWSQKRKNTLIICPAALKSMWENYIDEYNLPAKVISSGDLLFKNDDDNYTLNDDDKLAGYEIVIIDEAHNFRNQNTQKYKIVAPYLNGKKVILLTATPQNKSVWDIYYQIKLFHQKDITDLNISPNSLESYFKTYENNPHKIAELLQNFVIRRTRNDIKNNPKYKNVSIDFPKRILQTISYSIDESYTTKDHLTIYDTILDSLFRMNKTKRFKYAIYDLTGFLKPENVNKKTYQGLSYFGELVRGLLRVLLFKRLESSNVSFYESVKRMINRHRILLESIEKRNTVITGRADQLEAFLFSDETDEKLINKVSEYPIEDFKKDELIKTIQEDKAILEELCNAIEPIINEKVQDNKFIEFIEKILKPNLKNKILIFSEFSDTVEYLYKRTKALYPKLAIERISSAKTKAVDKTDIVRRFSPNSQTKGVGLNEVEKEIQILFTTDVLSEGQNLQDAFIIVNYDFHWNPVRLIQRIGRVDRIGSIADAIKVYNFLPDRNIESQLNLQGRVQNRINEIHQIFGSDSAILSDEEQLNEESVFSIYSDCDEMILDVDKGITTVFDEAEKVINDLITNDEAEFKRIINLPDGIRSSKISPIKGTFAYLQAGNFSKLYFNNAKENSDALHEILQIIKSENSKEKAQNVDTKTHIKNLAPIYKDFKNEIKRRALYFNTKTQTTEQKYFLERIRSAYNLFSTNEIDFKKRLDKLNEIFNKEIPLYAGQDVRKLKQQKLSDELMIEGLENIVEKWNIIEFQNTQLNENNSAIRTICSESLV